MLPGACGAGISAREVAEDWAYARADKGPYEIRELKEPATAGEHTRVPRIGSAGQPANMWGRERACPTGRALGRGARPVGERVRLVEDCARAGHSALQDYAGAGTTTAVSQ